jgi:hypothetical protein
MGFATFQFLRGTDRNRSNPSPIPMSKRLGAKWSLQCCIHVLLSPKLIKGSQNPIITKVQCLKSYYNKVHVRNPIIAKRNVWRVIIANFSMINCIRNILLQHNSMKAQLVPRVRAAVADKVHIFN